MGIRLEQPTCGLSACGEMLIVYCGKAALTKAASTTVIETVEKGILEDCANPSTPKVQKLIAQSISNCQEPDSYTAVQDPSVDLSLRRCMADCR